MSSSLISGSNGQLEVKQSASAQAYERAVAAGKKHLHFYAKGKKTVFDDAIITAWKEIGPDGKETLHVTERKGTVDPASGTAHLKDGQYEYGIGTHGTKSSGHIRIANDLARRNSSISTTKAGGKTRYTALRAQREIEIWRDTNKDGFLSEAEQRTSQAAINRRQQNYVGHDTIAINIPAEICHLFDGTTGARIEG